MGNSTLELFDPRNGDLTLRVEPLAEQPPLATPRRFNYFTIDWIRQGSGVFWADLARHPFQPGCVLFFNPYQAIRLVPDSALEGTRIQFHANFLCVETHNQEIGCNGVLFNDVYGIPLVRLDPQHECELGGLVESLRNEMAISGLAHFDLLTSYLKILLVKATRLKLDQQKIDFESARKRPPLLDDLKKLIEKHYRTNHSPSDYAELLHLAPNSLAKLVKTHLHKTVTELIRERLLKHAKWELLHTLKPIKLIAAELGFDDELYFSRLFKRANGLAPTAFRDYETAIRAGSNLSPTFQKA
jgi:AraC-like DNA-binding protein